MKPWTERILLVIISTTVALLIAEAILRIFGLGGTTLTRGKFHQNDSDAGWVGVPNADGRFYLPGSFNVRVVNNSRGLRDSKKDIAKPPGTWRIVVLGDSFMWGYGVENEQMFSTVLQESMPGTETINLGVRGYSTVQELIRFETEGLRYGPDLTLLVFFWNDLEDNFDDKKGGAPIVVVEGDRALIANRPVRSSWKSPVSQWFRHHSRLFAVGEYGFMLLKHIRKERKRANALRVKLDADDSLPARKRKDGAINLSAVDIYAPPGPEMELAWKAFSLLLSRIKESATKDGGRLIAVYATPMEAADKKTFIDEIRNAGLDPESVAFDWDRPSQRFVKVCSDLDIPSIDLVPAFRSHPNPLSLFLQKNAHWSAAGHRLAAETVAAKIEEFRGHPDF